MNQVGSSVAAFWKLSRNFCGLLVEMGVSGSKIEEDKALVLCRERKRFVRQALDGRCSLSAAHGIYIQSLGNVGTALRKFVEPEVPLESSLYMSTSVTPEHLGLTDKSISQFSYSSPSLSQHVKTAEHFSSIPAPPSSERYDVNYMRTGRSSATTIEEQPSIPVLQSPSSTFKGIATQSDENSCFKLPPKMLATPTLDYSGSFHPIDSQLSFQEGRSLNHELDNADNIRRLREEEGIPELEEEVENASTNGKDDFADSVDDFDQPSYENSVQMLKNRGEDLNSHSVNGSLAIHSEETDVSETEQPSKKKRILTSCTGETDETPNMTSSKATATFSMVALPMNGKEKENGSGSKIVAKDFILCMKEIEDLFVRAAESGKEFPRMLEANKMNFCPLFPEEIAHRSKASVFLTSCFSCCMEEAQLPQDPSPNEIKYLTWHTSESSLSSSSRIPLSTISKDSRGLNGTASSSICMNSGSHASTLNRLYAWERKLYDEVKASGIIRRDYDMKCRLLRHEESKGESIYKIDKTRATVKDLHSRIQVAIHRIDSISKVIEELRDNELQPQLEELIGGLTQMWAMMLDCHKHQYGIISVACNNGSTKVSIHSEYHQQATNLLEFELNTVCSSFTRWISEHKSYLHAINSWLHKCVFPLKHKSSRRRKVEEFDPKRDRAPPIFVTCRDWLHLLDTLPTKDVEEAIKDLVAVSTSFLPHQEKTQGNLKMSFSLPRKVRGGGEARDGIGRSEAPVDWSLNFDSLQLALVVFLGHLQTFAEKSVEKYRTLQKAIDAAKDGYYNRN